MIDDESLASKHYRRLGVRLADALLCAHAEFETVLAQACRNMLTHGDFVKCALIPFSEAELSSTVHAICDYITERPGRERIQIIHFESERHPWGKDVYVDWLARQWAPDFLTESLGQTERCGGIENYRTSIVALLLLYRAGEEAVLPMYATYIEHVAELGERLFLDDGVPGIRGTKIVKALAALDNLAYPYRLNDEGDSPRRLYGNRE